MKTLRIASLIAIIFFQMNDLQGYTRQDASRHFRATLKGITAVVSAAVAVRSGRDYYNFAQRIAANHHALDLQHKNLALTVTSVILSATMAKSAYDEIKNK